MINLFQSVCSLLLAGSFFFGSVPCWGKVREGAVIDGVDVGGMRYENAETCVREELGARLSPFTLCSPAGDLQIALSFSDNVGELVRKAKKGEELFASVKRVWTDAEADVMRLCRLNAKEPTNATVSFDGKSFTYTKEKSGVICDYRLSLQNALQALSCGDTECEIVTREYPAEITVKTLKAQTRRLASFVTYFDGTNAPRSHNIALAASRISGYTLLPHETFSFNETVGKRTKENGFEDAAVIFEGEFVQGTGGGVCQASTTLMNAALHAGLKVIESRNHSLSVGYVSPSLDAMVSEYSDLKFENPYDFPVYLAGATGSNYIRFTVYGKPDGNRYETESRIRYYIAPPPAEIVEGEEEKTVREEKQGLASESYLLVYDSCGALISRKLFRRDTYAARQGIYSVKPQPPAEGETAEEKEVEPTN